MRIFLFVICFIFISDIAHANLRDGLIAWWKLDETSGTSAFDSSWKGNTQTATGTTIVSNCIRNNCRSFNGSSDFMKTSANFSYSAATPISISAWVNTNTTTNASGFYRRVVVPGSSTAGDGQVFSFVANAGVMTSYYSVDGATNIELSDSITMTPGKWYHFVATYDGSIIRLYRDGVVITAAVGVSLVAIPANPTRIGIYGDETNGAWSGSIDDVRIYNRQLTVQEIQDLYNAGIRKNYAPGT